MSSKLNNQEIQLNQSVQRDSNLNLFQDHLEKSPINIFQTEDLNLNSQQSPIRQRSFQYKQPQKKVKNKIIFKNILNEVLDKKKWQEKWKKIKDFVKKKRSQGRNKNSERDDVFNAILALYAGDEEDEVFSELAILYEKYPEEIEFYVPQLCTYLFHFNSYQPKGSAIHPSTHQGQHHQELLEKFLLNRARRSLKFAHLIFWYIIAGLDDSESIQLSQHQSPQIWEFLSRLINTAEEQIPRQSFGSSEEQKNQDELLKNSIQLPKKEELADTGSSSVIRYEYTQGMTQLDSMALISRHDQQIIRTLTNNMAEHQMFFSTPKFVSDLIHISEVLKTVNQPDRNDMLTQLLQQLNKNLPANVYIPISHDNIISSKFQNKKSSSKSITSHKILQVCTDFNFCLHSKERVPYHVIIEVEYEEPEFNSRSSSHRRDTLSGDDSSHFSTNDAGVNDKNNKQSNIQQKSKANSGGKIIPDWQKNKSNTQKGKQEQQQFIEMQVFNSNFQTSRKESSHIFSDEDFKSQNQSKYLNDDDYQVQRKAKSLENERNVGKKYKLEKNKLTKEYSQDFLEEYKSVSNPSNRPRGHKKNNFSKKFYESDANNESAGSKKNVNNLSDTMVDEKSDDDDDFLYYKYQQKSLVAKMCSCFTSSQEIVYDQQQCKPAGLFGQKTYEEAQNELKQKSRFSGLKNHGFISVIVKSGDDLRQEQFASQLISKFKDIFESHKLQLWLKPFNIIATCNDGGLIQTIPDTLSIDRLKKTYPQYPDLRSYFVNTYGGGSTQTGQSNAQRKKRFKEARNNFIQSMAGYSLLCYILQIKDRHNGNILLDSKGHVVHVDFGFLLSNSPGNFNFEAVTFKLTQEYVDVMGGTSSPHYEKFTKLMTKGFLYLREHAEEIISFVEMTMISGIDLPCFQGSDRVLESLRERFKLEMSKNECKQFIRQMVNKSTNNLRTKLYDFYQKKTVGIW